MAEIEIKTIEEIELRLKQIKKIKHLILNARKVHQEDLLIYTQKIKLLTSDCEAIKEITDEINALDERYSKILLEESDLKYELRIKKAQSEKPIPQPM